MNAGQHDSLIPIKIQEINLPTFNKFTQCFDDECDVTRFPHSSVHQVHRKSNELEGNVDASKPRKKFQLLRDREGGRSRNTNAKSWESFAPDRRLP